MLNMPPSVSLPLSESDLVSLLARDGMQSIISELNVDVSIPNIDWLDVRWKVANIYCDALCYIIQLYACMYDCTYIG